MLNIENITVKISNSIILRDINMIAKKGLITCIMGKNGMGKTISIRDYNRPSCFVLWVN